MGTLGILEILAISGGTVVALITLIFFKDKSLRDEMRASIDSLREDLSRQDKKHDQRTYQLSQECIKREELSRILDKMDKIEEKLTRFVEKVYNGVVEITRLGRWLMIRDSPLVDMATATTFLRRRNRSRSGQLILSR